MKRAQRKAFVTGRTEAVFLQIIAAAVLPLMLVGCRETSEHRASSAPPVDFSAYRTPTNLARQIAGADRIVVTNGMPKYRGFSLVLSGDKAKEIVRAVSAAKCYSGQMDPGWVTLWELRFYQGTNHLATVPFMNNGIVDQRESEGRSQRPIYDDESGRLTELYREVTARAANAPIIKAN